MDLMVNWKSSGETTFPGRRFLYCAFGLLAGLGAPIHANTAFANGDGVIETVRAVEARLGGRVGVAIRQGDTGWRWEHRADERFPMSSTFKSFACGAVLARVDAGKENLERIVKIDADDIVSYSPVTKNRTGGDGMAMSQVCDAAVTVSDNTAGNIVLKSLGGPEGFTKFMRSIGDQKTRIDRWETDLNQGKPGDERDTTTPRAAADSLRSMLLGDALSPRSREQLTNWMLNDKVADALFRSVLPAGWRIADKTGAGGHGSRALIAVLWPPAGEPIIAAVYLNGNGAEFADRNAAIAEIGSAIIKAMSK